MTKDPHQIAAVIFKLWIFVLYIFNERIKDVQLLTLDFCLQYLMKYSKLFSFNNSKAGWKGVTLQDEVRFFKSQGVWNVLKLKILI